jgi:2-dehydro-3-deoxygalactonokinase
VADWGTSSFRLWLFDQKGAAIAERRSGEGMLSAGPDRFSAILERHLADMGVPDDLPVMICGMAGARQGWIEAPYVAVPAALGEILDGAVSVRGIARRVLIVPGLAQRREDAPDVMRGEETQLAGISGLLGSGSRLVCMPGTHSKWVETSNGTVAGFRTWLTGELFSVLSKQSILRHSIGDAPAPIDAGSAAFRNACETALKGEGDIGGALFPIRAAGLLHGLGSDDAAARLSGLLIGAEIASATRRFGQPEKPIILVASGAVGELYAAALGLAGHAVERIDGEEAVRAGLVEAARRHGMTQGVRS